MCGQQGRVPGRASRRRAPPPLAAAPIIVAWQKDATRHARSSAEQRVISPDFRLLVAPPRNAPGTCHFSSVLRPYFSYPPPCTLLSLPRPGRASFPQPPPSRQPRSCACVPAIGPVGVSLLRFCDVITLVWVACERLPGHTRPHTHTNIHTHTYPHPPARARSHTRDNVHPHRACTRT